MTPRAASLYRESLALQIRIDDRYGMPFNLQGLGQAAIRLGQHADGAWLLGALARRAADPADPAIMTYEEFLEWADEDTLAEWVAGKVEVNRTIIPRLDICDIYLHHRNKDTCVIWRAEYDADRPAPGTRGGAR